MPTRPLSLAVLVSVACLAGCGGGGDDARFIQSDRRVAELEERVADLEAQLRAAEEQPEEASPRDPRANQVATAVAQLDDMDFLEMSQRIRRGGAATPGETARMRGAARLLKHVDWPAELQHEADQLIEVLDQFTEALVGRDTETARAIAGTVFHFQREIVRKADRWLEATAPWQRTTTPAHAHGGGDAHADHSPHHGGQLGMQGDLHVELVRAGSGRYEVHLTDAYRKPVSVEGVTGALLLLEGTDAEVSVGLEAEGTERLVVSGAPDPDGNVQVEVQLRGTSEGDVDMTFLLAKRGAQTRPATQPARQPATQPATRSDG